MRRRVTQEQSIYQETAFPYWRATDKPWKKYIVSLVWPVDAIIIIIIISIFYIYIFARASKTAICYYGICKQLYI